MENKTVGELAFEEAREFWNRETKTLRRFVLRELKQEEVYAECNFEQLPAAQRDALIDDVKLMRGGVSS